MQWFKQPIANANIEERKTMLRKTSKHLPPRQLKTGCRSIRKHTAANRIRERAVEHSIKHC